MRPWVVEKMYYSLSLSLSISLSLSLKREREIVQNAKDDEFNYNIIAGDCCIVVAGML